MSAAALTLESETLHAKPEPPRTESRRYRNPPDRTYAGLACNSILEESLGGACFTLRPGDTSVDIVIEAEDAIGVGARYGIYRESNLLFQGSFCGESGRISLDGEIADSLVVSIDGPSHCEKSETGTVMVSLNQPA